MTSQAKKNPKTAFLVRLTNENYDYLCRVASRMDMSMAKAMNDLIETSKSDITICRSSQERIVNSNG
jgi:hypothetical protein